MWRVRVAALAFVAGVLAVAVVGQPSDRIRAQGHRFGPAGEPPPRPLILVVRP